MPKFFKKNKNKNKIVAFIGILLISVALSFSIPAKKSEALFGFGDIVIDIKALIEEVLRHVLVRTLKTANERFTKDFLNKAISKLGVQNYLGYARAVADKVYIGYELVKEADVERQFLLRVNAQNQLGVVTTVRAPNLVDIYNRRALSRFNNAALAGSLAAAAQTNRAWVDWRGYTDFLANPQTQRLDAIDKAGVIVASARAATQNNISSGNGYKDAFNCKQSADNSKNSVLAAQNAEKNADSAKYQAGQETQAEFLANQKAINDKYSKLEGQTNTNYGVAIASCVIKNPADYVTNQVDTKINGLFAGQIIPQNTSTAIGAFIGDTLAKQLSNQLFSGGAQSGSIIQDLLK